MEDLLNEPHPGLEQVEFKEVELLRTSMGEPCSFAEVEREEAWRAAMRDEINSVERNKTWELVNLPARHQAIGLKWAFKLKCDKMGEVIKHKARLVARGFGNRPASILIKSMCLWLTESRCECFWPLKLRRAGLSTTWTSSRPS
jgi:hypothetical protein